MNDQDDRRAEPRVQVDASRIQVLDPSNKTVLGTLANLSNHGLMLNSASHFTEQASYQALICWPDDDGQDQQVALGLLALWCSNGPSASQWIGFEIIDISDQDQRRLEALIAAASQ